MNARRMVGIGRSLLMYYGPFWRRARMDAFYRQFIAPGDLCFDVGAHVGNRVGSWLRLGARVVAVEPQPDFYRLLRRLYGRRARVTLLACGLGEAPGRREMLISTRTPTVSTFSPDWISQARADERFAGLRWDERQTVEMETLDRLIERLGEPAFCKIDVEGHEEQVLAGLSRPLRGLSFEFIPVASDRAAACVRRVASLGAYRFRWSPVETMRWGADRWLSADEMIDVLAGMPIDGGSGDVYAVDASALPPAER
jgi:FkbM family methyltransferase